MLAGVVAGRGWSNSNRWQSGKRVARRRFAKKPKERMRTKPRGSTCSRKRRKNSEASSVIILLNLYFTHLTVKANRKLVCRLGPSRVATRSGGPTFLLAVSVQYKVAALETGLHFPYVILVVSLRSVHCRTDTVLTHRRCSLGTTKRTETGENRFASPRFATIRP